MFLLKQRNGSPVGVATGFGEARELTLALERLHGDLNVKLKMLPTPQADQMLRTLCTLARWRCAERFARERNRSVLAVDLVHVTCQELRATPPKGLVAVVEVPMVVADRRSK